MTNEKLPLSVGASPGQRVFAAIVGVLFTAIGAAFVLLPMLADGLLRRITGFGDPLPSYEDARDLPPGMLPPDLSGSPSAGLGPGRLVGLCGIPFALLGLYLVLRVLRTAAWLEGTRAHVRGVLGTRAVDLAAAEVTAGAVGYRAGDEAVVRVPTLVARDPGTGRRVTIPLRGMGLATLPPHELRALADAITAGRPTGGRHDEAHALAGRLRTMAGNPLGG
ncbi:hypothetical protein GA0070624_1866 [Micromonospora rhizosphaerae]|uniref:Uncharacterized protein n=1 Tax=Micromonospora rhizosphaerae TaxID=568872 RepID=A0A1C6RS54_9ACTN|nr:hypothetical protein [Micromonospora rhizosphaerae]SCL19903.1 hypothetical protein GA0070624_1866 [Micromonospora rhizosphaerae]